MNKKYIFFNKKKGIIFGSLAWIIAFCSFTIAIVLYITADPSYSIFTHQLSGLSPGKNFSNVALFIGLAFTGIFQTPFYVSIGLSLRQKKSNWKLIRIAMGASIISSIILIMLVPFLSDPEKPTFSIMHGILGGIHFVVILYSLMKSF